MSFFWGDAHELADHELVTISAVDNELLLGRHILCVCACVCVRACVCVYVCVSVSVSVSVSISAPLLFRLPPPSHRLQRDVTVPRSTPRTSACNGRACTVA